MTYKKNKINLFLIFKDFIKNYPKEFSLLFFLLIIEGLVAALSVITLIPIADFIVDSHLINPSKLTKFIINNLNVLEIKPSFYVFGSIFVISNILKGLIEVAIRYSILKIKHVVLRGLYFDALNTFFKAKWIFFSNTDQGLLLNTMNRELNNIGDTLSNFATFAAQVVQLIIYLLVPIWLNPFLTIMSVCLSIIFSIPFMLLNKYSYRLGRKNVDTANSAIGILMEILSSARLILGFGRQNKSLDNYLKAYDQHVGVTLKSQILNTAIVKFFQPLAMTAVIISMGLSLNNKTPISELGAIMWSLLAAMPILSSLLQIKVTINHFTPSYEQLIELKNAAFELEELQSGKQFVKLENDIILENINFKYPNRSQTLKNINITIKKGKVTALVGTSGSGKSTLTDIVLGLQKIDSGIIKINSEKIENFNINSFREKIGYVPQDSQLFHISIRENLLWSNENANENDLWQCLELANASTFIKELPNGIDTLVGDRGIRLSGGQRQRIALARALLRKPELLILDEATSSLDTESEILIQRSILKVSKNTTILIVAHRISTISNADHVYVLNNGQLVEDGSFAFLSLKENGYLKKMLQEQNISK